MYALIDCRTNDTSLSAIRALGHTPILMPPASYLDAAVASHTDMLLFIGFGRLFCHARYYEEQKELIDTIISLSSLELTLSYEETSNKYPHDVLFNACLVTNSLICNEKSVSKLILNAARDAGCQIISVTQGYTKCSICPVSDNAIITADKSIASACENVGIEVLLISEGDVCLPPYNFGFIGGASGILGDTVFFCGSLDTHKDGKAICDFCQKHKKIALSLSSECLQDVGSIFFVGEEMEESKRYWNEKYWVRHMRDDDLDHIEDAWVDKYDGIISAKSGKLLDLGCGVGQYSKYFYDKGFSVTSADISERALAYLSSKYHGIDTVRADMTKPLPFADKSFDVVFANLSIHFFSEGDTRSLIAEIKRVLKDDGIFVGSCNSSRAYKYIADCSTVLEEGFYRENEGRTVRLFDKAQFERFFADWQEIILVETETVRFNKSKNMWEFIYKK
ncbi:MAG: methyltransferase domain-containing protein [Clostridia bacterium]|nr:methyltransferase domain-containing protein [Clostridia bacterium]